MFSAALINDPADDPGVYMEFKYRREALLFDLGDIHRLPARKILKVKYIFVSHAHVDHFIGFDHLLRICLGRDQHISIFGPLGFLERVESKLRGYTWNLVENYTNDFELVVTEVHQTQRITRHYRCRNAFRPEEEIKQAITDAEPVLVDEDSFSVKAVLLDHSIPCLAFSFEEKTRLNIKKNVLQDMGLPTGPWLTRLKEQIMNKDPQITPVRIWWKNEEGVMLEKFLPLGILQEKAVKVTVGKKVCYITDALWSEGNIGKMVELARGAELLFIEAPFLQEDADTAAKKYHLTACQAGALAAMAEAKRFSIFHLSPKYKGMEGVLQKEALAGFEGKKHLDNPGQVL